MKAEIKKLTIVLRQFGVVIDPDDVAVELCADERHIKCATKLLEAGRDIKELFEEW